MYSNILVALDGSETSAHALDAALRLARGSHALLHPLYVIDVPLVAFDTPGFDPSIICTAFRQEGERVIDDARNRMARQQVNGSPRIVETTGPGEDVAHRIALAADECAADLIVMGTHGRRGFRRLVLGSVAERVLRIASCPVLMIPAQAKRGRADDATARHADKELS
jgi:nucleotide-binding universal stress UspA family protein